MYRASSLSNPTTCVKRGSNRNGFTPNAAKFSTFEKEALQIFNQVTANKNRILKKNSDGAFYSKTTVRTKKFDADGKEVIENFEATSYGGITEDGQKVGEIVQKYHNENSGAEKTSLQRIMGDKRRRIEVKRTFDFESTKELIENVDSEFEREWRRGAKAIGVRRVVGFDRKLETISPKKLN